MKNKLWILFAMISVVCFGASPSWDSLNTGSFLSNSFKLNLSSAVSNQWRLDATNAAVKAAHDATNGFVSGGPSSSPAQSALFVIGDSMSDIGGVPGLAGWVQQLRTNDFGSQVSIVNFAKSSDMVSNDAVNFDARYSVMLSTMVGRSNDWALIWKGYNDTGPYSSNQISTNLLTVANRLHGYGIKVCGVTIIHTNDGSAGYSTVLGVNKWITNSGVFDATIDAFSFVTLGPDNVHPSEAGCTALSQSIATNIPIAKLTTAGPSFVGGITVKQPPVGFGFNGIGSDPVSTLYGSLVLAGDAVNNQNGLSWYDPPHRRASTIVRATVNPITSDYDLGIYTYGVIRMLFPGPNWPVSVYPTLLYGDLTVTNALTNGVSDAASGNLKVVGAVAANSFSGGGSALTGFTSGQIPDLSVTYERHVAVLTNSYYASNTVSGGQFPAGTVAVNGIRAGAFIGSDGTSRIWTNDAVGLTNIPAAQLTGSVADARLSANVPIMSSGFISNPVDSSTNTWAINTALPVGTNCFISQGAATIGFTAVANVPTSTERYGQLTIAATGTITFTNPASVHASDFQSSRTITNGNWCVVALDVIPGQITNMAIVQFK
jgi:hypothetical protein